jgi:hypothetical protein
LRQIARDNHLPEVREKGKLIGDQDAQARWYLIAGSNE